MYAHVNTPPPQPSTARPDVPVQFDEVIATGMAKDPDQRYATTVELASAAHDAITTPIPRPAQNLRTPPSFVTNPAPPPPPPAPDAVWQQPSGQNLAATSLRPPGRSPVPQPRPANRPPPQIGTPPPRPHDQRRQVKVALIAATVVILAAVGITGYLLWPHSPASQTPTAQPAPPSGQTAQPAPPSGQTAQPAPPPVQTVLPFTGLNSPDDVAADAAGNVYVTDYGNYRVLKLSELGTGVPKSRCAIDTESLP
jgi:serine/threonine-protein kinase